MFGGFGMFGGVVEWVEKGTAPASVTATGRAFPDAAACFAGIFSTRTTQGTGNPDDAASFECWER